jgi:WD40 repeat protein
MCKLSLHNALEWSFAMRSNGLSVFIALNTLLIFLLSAAMMSNTASVSAQGVRQVATPTFSARPPISAANVQRVTELRRLGFGFINEVRYSLDGKSLAVAGSAGIWLYNAQDLSAAPRLLTGHADTVSAVAWSPDGRSHRFKLVRFDRARVGRGERAASADAART